MEVPQGHSGSLSAMVQAGAVGSRASKAGRAEGGPEHQGPGWPPALGYPARSLGDRVLEEAQTSPDHFLVGTARQQQLLLRHK